MNSLKVNTYILCLDQNAYYKQVDIFYLENQIWTDHREQVV